MRQPPPPGVPAVDLNDKRPTAGRRGTAGGNPGNPSSRIGAWEARGSPQLVPTERAARQWRPGLVTLVSTMHECHLTFRVRARCLTLGFDRLCVARESSTASDDTVISVLGGLMSFYLAGIATLLAAAVALRLTHGLTHGRSSERDLTPEMAGYLAAGPRRAIHAAIAVLRGDGAVAVTWAGSLKRMQAPSQDLDPLPDAIYETIARPTRARALAGDPPVRHALAAIRAELATRGLVTRPWRRWSLGLLAAGVVVLGLTTTTTEPTTGLTAAIAAASTAAASTAAAVSLCWLPRRTSAGRHALRTLHEQFPPPDDSDASTEHAGMAVALYGRLDVAGIENITARPPRRRSRRRGPDLTHSSPPDPPWLNAGGSF